MTALYHSRRLAPRALVRCFAASMLLLPIAPGELTAMCLLRNRIQPGQVPLAEIGQPTLRTLASYPGAAATNDGSGRIARFGDHKESRRAAQLKYFWRIRELHDPKNWS